MLFIEDPYLSDVILLHFKQWCAGEEGEGIKEPWFVVLAYFCGVNSPTMADSKPLMCNPCEHGVIKKCKEMALVNQAAPACHLKHIRSLCILLDPETIIL